MSWKSRPHLTKYGGKYVLAVPRSCMGLINHEREPEFEVITSDGYPKKIRVTGLFKDCDNFGNRLYEYEDYKTYKTKPSTDSTSYYFSDNDNKMIYDLTPIYTGGDYEIVWFLNEAKLFKACEYLVDVYKSTEDKRVQYAIAELQPVLEEAHLTILKGDLKCL